MAYPKAADCETLGARILGAWDLVTYEVRQGPDLHFPLGPRATGSLIYTPTGEVSVNLMAEGRARTSVGSIWQIGDETAGKLVRSYMAYSGRYTVDEAVCVIHHEIRLCLDPAMIGSPQLRHACFIGEDLELRAEMQGVRQACLRWRRPA